jgi:glycosyltransferase involved in cell wall biosynthesis
MRVGLVIGQLTTGGAEGQLRLLCEGFDRAAISPTVYCLSDQTEPNGSLLARAGIPVRAIAGGQLDRAKRLRRALTADRIDVVHTWLFIANAYGWVANFRAPRALVTSARNCKRQGRLLDTLNRRAFNASDAIIVNSAEVQHYIEHEYAAPAQHITVIPNAIDLERFRARSRPGESAHVITVGRLVRQKNPLLFVAAAAALREHLPAAHFTMIGDGPMRGEVEAAVRAAGLADVCRLAGERADVHELLSQADLFWLTSDWEGLPNALIEALASGLPAVVTDVGGTRDLVDDGVEGFVVMPQNADAIVQPSLAILGDAERRTRMSAAARRRAERFGVGQMVRATQAVYERALERRAA